jgi:CubicO group peptidase (beta-lactamase class C family)
MKPTLTKYAKHLAIAGFGLSTLSLEGQSLVKPVLESSINNGPWTTISPHQFRTIPDGRLWLPFQDEIVRYRLRIDTFRSPATGVSSSREFPSLPLQPEEGSFFSLTESADLQNWTTLDASSLSFDPSGLILPANTSGKSFLDLTVIRRPPEPTPYELARLTPNRNASFRETPWRPNPPGAGGGLMGGGTTIDPFDNPTSRVPFPGAHAFNKYLFEERIHQIFEGEIKGYGLVLANEDGFQSTVSGGWARDPADPNLGGVGMSTFRPGNIGSCAKLYTGVALMQLLSQKGPDLNTALDESIAPYLPPLWLNPNRRPANVTPQQAQSVVEKANNTTFRMLLDHTAGITDLSVSDGAPENLQDNPDYYHFSQPLGGTRGCVAYGNEHYRIMTYLIASLVDGPALLAAHLASAQLPMDQYLDTMRDAYGQSFESYMRDQFFPQVKGSFAPSPDPATDYNPGTTALMYSDPGDTQGLEWNQVSLNGFARGQGGYWSSARELSRFMMSVMYTEDLLTANERDLLFGQTFNGCNFPADLPLINNGRATHPGFANELNTTWWRSKQGRQSSGIAPFGTSIANAMFLPYGWVCSYTGNSDHTNGDSQDALFTSVLDAFWDATRDEPATISREAMTTTRFNKTAQYLGNHHMSVKWLDLYDVNGTPHVNAVFGDAPEPVAGQIGLNAAQYQQFLDHWVKNLGFSVQQVESYLHHGLVRYAAIITKEDRPEQRAYHGNTYNTHLATANSWADDGFIPVNVSVVSVNNSRSYTALYEKRNLAYRMQTRMTAVDYNQKFQDYLNDGYKVVSLNAYRHNGETFYAAIWHRLGGGQAGIHEADRHGYRAADADQLNGGRLPTIITGVDAGAENPAAASRHRFGAIWR